MVRLEKSEYREPTARVCNVSRREEGNSAGSHFHKRSLNWQNRSISCTTAAISKLRQFTPHLPVSFGRDTKSRWSLLSGVYASGSKRSHTGGICVTCSGLTNSREGQF